MGFSDKPDLGTTGKRLRAWFVGYWHNRRAGCLVFLVLIGGYLTLCLLPIFFGSPLAPDAPVFLILHYDLPSQVAFVGKDCLNQTARTKFQMAGLGTPIPAGATTIYVRANYNIRRGGRAFMKAGKRQIEINPNRMDPRSFAHELKHHEWGHTGLPGWLDLLNGLYDIEIDVRLSASC